VIAARLLTFSLSRSASDRASWLNASPTAKRRFPGWIAAHRGHSGEEAGAAPLMPPRLVHRKKPFLLNGALSSRSLPSVTEHSTTPETTQPESFRNAIHPEKGRRNHQTADRERELSTILPPALTMRHAGHFPIGPRTFCPGVLASSTAVLPVNDRSRPAPRPTCGRLAAVQAGAPLPQLRSLCGALCFETPRLA
jgi:hypothetical protein